MRAFDQCDTSLFAANSDIASSETPQPCIAIPFCELIQTLAKRDHDRASSQTPAHLFECEPNVSFARVQVCQHLDTRL